MKKLILFIVLLLISFSCKEKIVDQGTDVFIANSTSSCVGCHTDKELLAVVADPLEDTGGEAGEG